MSIPYPSGAEALLIAIQTPAPKGHLGIPVLVWGRPGVGKSSFLEALARDDFPVLTLIASIHDPTDFSGLPVFSEGRVNYAVPEWVEQLKAGGRGILFLDELTTAPPSVQAALLRVVLERQVGFHPLPPGVRIVAAANPPDLMSGGWELTPPLRNRFVHLTWHLPPETYIEALSGGWPAAQLPTIDPAAHAELLPRWQLRIAAFLKRAPELLHGEPDQDPYAFASPRSWDFAAALLTSCELLEQAPTAGRQGSPACLALLKGCLGEGTALPFLEFLQHLKLPDPLTYLYGQAECDPKQLNDSELYVFIGSLSRLMEQWPPQADFLPAAERYFNFITAVIADGRRDLIYVPLKKLTRTPFLPRVSRAATEAGPTSGKALMAQLREILGDTGLGDYLRAF